MISVRILYLFIIILEIVAHRMLIWSRVILMTRLREVLLLDMMVQLGKFYLYRRNIEVADKFGTWFNRFKQND